MFLQRVYVDDINKFLNDSLHVYHEEKDNNSLLAF